MPCDTPPPPIPLEDANEDGNFEELDESMYDFIDPDELENIPDPNDDSIITFVGHTAAIFMCNFDKSGEFVVTGGQDETAYVWEVCNGTVKFEFTGHKDSVIFANFSPDGRYVASADMSGIVKVFEMNDGNLVWEFDTFEVTWAEWLNGSNVLIAGSIDGTTWRWSIPDGDSYVYENPGISNSTGAISNDDGKLAVGYSNGTMKFWDLHTNSLLGSLSAPHCFTAPVTVIKYSPDNTLMIASSEDGTVKLIKVSNLKVLWSFVVCEVDHEHNSENVSVEALGFCHNPSLIAVGTNCGVIGVYDISSKTKRFNVTVDSSVIKIVCDDQDPIMYVALAESIIQAYDIRTGLVLRTWYGHKETLLDLSISRDRSLLISCGDDCTCKLFERGILGGLA